MKSDSTTSVSHSWNLIVTTVALNELEPTVPPRGITAKFHDFSYVKICKNEKDDTYTIDDMFDINSLKPSFTKTGNIFRIINEKKLNLDLIFFTVDWKTRKINPVSEELVMNLIQL